MRDAGRVCFIIKGYYNNETQYENLDIVYYGNSSYVAKKDTIGNKPEENNEYWQIIAKGRYASFQIVNSISDLPDNGLDGVFYLVPNGGTEDNKYNEYIWDPITLSYELIGALQTDIDLTGYAMIEDIPAKVSQLDNDSGYLTEIPEEYITQEELKSMGFVKEENVIVPTYEETLTLLNE